MKITKITTQIKNSSRVSIYVNNKYTFSLDLAQLADSGLKKGDELSQKDIEYYKDKSKVGKLFAKTVDYCFMRPRSTKELRDYLYKKTLSKKYKSKKDSQIYRKDGLSERITQEVYEKILDKGLVDDQKFAKWWVDNRNLNKGSSFKKMRYELMSKGVDTEYIDEAFDDTERSNEDELEKVISKKLNKYKDKEKMLAYLARQGFNYSDIQESLDKYY